MKSTFFIIAAAFCYFVAYLLGQKVLTFCHETLKPKANVQEDAYCDTFMSWYERSDEHRSKAWVVILLLIILFMSFCGNKKSHRQIEAEILVPQLVKFDKPAGWFSSNALMVYCPDKLNPDADNYYTQGMDILERSGYQIAVLQKELHVPAVVLTSYLFSEVKTIEKMYNMSGSELASHLILEAKAALAYAKENKVEGKYTCDWHTWGVSQEMLLTMQNFDLENFFKEVPCGKGEIPTNRTFFKSERSGVFKHAVSIRRTEEIRNDAAPKDVSSIKEEAAKDYIKRFAPVAIKEMEKYGIPASISLAQGLVESGAGTSTLARKNNNHFGLKCFSKNCMKGHCSNHTDDSHKDFFLKFNSAWESWRAHSLLLQKDRYRPLYNYGKDYKKWAKGLKEAGYATDPQYAGKLIRVIEKYKLYNYDK